MEEGELVEVGSLGSLPRKEGLDLSIIYVLLVIVRSKGIPF